MKTLYRLTIFLSLSSLIANSCKKEYSCESCNSANQLPMADAGADQSFNLPKDSTFLNGEASSDTDGTTTSFQWKKISGPNSFYIRQTSASKTVVRWFKVPSVQNAVNYNFDGDSYRLWILRTPEDPTLEGKESSIKIKFL